MSETWLPVRGVGVFDALFEVSNLGQVRGLATTARIKGGGTRVVPERMMKPRVNGDGYWVVDLSHNSKSIVARVHRLVALAFLGDPEPGQEVCHRDGDRLNPALENLRWGSRSDNVRDAVEHGTHWNVAKTHCPQNHPYDEENTRWWRGWRYCRSCERVNKIAYSARRSQLRLEKREEAREDAVVAAIRMGQVDEFMVSGRAA